jgi:hypothetical protein
MIDYDSCGHRVRTFDERHGDFVLLEDDYLYFADGARRERNPLGLLDDGPTDPVKRQKRIVFFWEKKLELAIEEFSVRKRSMLAFVRAHLKDSRSAAPGRDPEQIAVLKNLKKKVVAANTCLDLAKQKLKELQPRVERDEKQHAEALQRLAEYEQEIQHIEV